tara:strand:+ start:2098 stop:2724 length:627 start_codon:yes stop_codon:yes gene_type:complete
MAEQPASDKITFESRSITNFRNRLVGGGARPNFFEVNITIPPSVNKFADVDTDMRFMIKAAEIPAANLGNIPIPFRGRVLPVAGDRTFDPWTVTVINDTSFNIRDAMEQWSNSINDLQFDGGITNPAGYQTDAFVTQLGRVNDNKGTLSDGEDSMQQIRQYKFFGIYPSVVSSIPLDYGSTDAIEEFQVTFNYIYWTVMKGKNIVGSS